MNTRPPVLSGIADTIFGKRFRSPVVQFAIPQMTSIAKRKAERLKNKSNQLIYKGFFKDKSWHAHCIISCRRADFFSSSGAGKPKMNMILTALNAATLVALVSFHFYDTASQDNQVNAHVQVQHPLRQAPQLAIMADKGANPAMLTNDAQEMPQATGSAAQRWVF